MGIPSFFREILTKYQNTHFWDPNFVVKYLLLDYNAMVHNMVAQYFKSVSYDAFKSIPVSKRDDIIVKFVIEKTLEFVNEVVKPERLLYIAIDGPAPRSKMELQRFRRYRSIKGELYMDVLRERYNIQDSGTLWNKSAMISPGTPFMTKLSTALWNAINKKMFMDGKISVILSDTTRPGEGEHKILPFIRALKNKGESVVIYSPDADLIVLTLPHPGDIYIIRPKDKNSEEEMKQYPENDYIYLSINKYREAFLDRHHFQDVDPIRFSRDLMFITFFGGNDFCRAIPFLKINKGGLNQIARTYKKVYHRFKHTSHPYLVEMKEITTEGDKQVVPLVNQAFLAEILKEFAKIEDFKMKEEYERILSKIDREYDEVEDTYEAQRSAFEHSKYYEATNPFAFPDLFKTINYQLPKNQWKDQYYSHFFGISPENPREYREYKKMICHQYLKGLEYTIRYYLTGIPSWNWHYPFRVAPMPSDILYFMRDVPKDLNFDFTLGESYTPLEQLAMIIPPQSADALPRVTRSLLTSVSSPLIPFYPIDFQLDILAGEKFIYSEPILPLLVDELVIPFLHESFTKLTPAEKKRNTLTNAELVFIPPNQNKLTLLINNRPDEPTIDQPAQPVGGSRTHSSQKKSFHKRPRNQERPQKHHKVYKRVRRDVKGDH